MNNSRCAGSTLPADPRPDQRPDRILQAIAEPTIDHRGPGFADPGHAVLTGLQRVFGTILRDRVFRIGHLGDFNDLSLIGALGGVEMGLRLAGIPHSDGGVDAAMVVLARAT